MYRKTLSLVLAFVMIFSLASCGSGNSGNDPGPGPSANPSPSVGGNDGGNGGNGGNDGSGGNDGGSNPAGQTKANYPGEAYSNYVTAKSEAMERVTDALDEVENGWAYSLSLLSIAFIDLALLPLSFFIEGGNEALAFFSYEDCSLTQNGDTHTLTYKDDEGGSVSIVCEFDAATESLKVSMQSDGVESLYFESVKAGDGYASQYYSSGDGGSLIAIFFDGGSMIIGLLDGTQKPDTIYKKSVTASFVPETGTYIAITGGTLKIIDNGSVVIG